MSATNPGQVLLAGIESDRLAPHELSIIQQIRPAGVTLFKRNIPPNYQRVTSLTDSLHKLSGDPHLPMLIAIDQEGGRVSRLPEGFPNMGPAEQLFGGKDDAAALESLYRYGQDVGWHLKEIGININFAPVADVLSNPNNTAIGDRVFATNPQKAAKRAGAFLTGMQETGIWGCLKHFPGQGAAPADTHKASAIISDDLKTLIERDVAPFKSLIPEAAMVMISHCIYPALDAQKPASLSAKIMRDLLQDKMGFYGVVVSDDMNMEAINQNDDAWLDAMVEAIIAGADLLLVCRHIEKTLKVWERFQVEAARSNAFAQRLAEAATKVNKLRRVAFNPLV